MNTNETSTHVNERKNETITKPKDGGLEHVELVLFKAALSTATDDRMMALSKEERMADRMMDLSKEKRIELLLLSGREGWSYRKIAEEFNLRHPYSCSYSDGDHSGIGDVIVGNVACGDGFGGPAERSRYGIQ
ncbi:Hypothetical predicted protein [Octopus vulgaris]|uniref:Uncharacterized protein n=1 Tax=Octopus vulgaris TaxID=6645 RepID=A0AA36F588_OCTVU|nr:Hypothetical predicted protein [Octopus vulgaris]